jgi:CHAT domain
VHLAAALALANQRADRALELLELWRQIRYDQMLGLRSDLTDLGERHPNLADRVTRLRGLFDSPAPDGQEGADIRESAGERRRLGESWQSLLTEVRALPGFSRFAMPPSAQELAAEAAHGAIAVLNVSRYGSHALLLANSGIRVLPLPGLTPETVLRRVESFREALFTATDGELPDRRAAQESLTETLQWLWDAAVGPVLDALGYRDQPPGGTAWPPAMVVGGRAAGTTAVARRRLSRSRGAPNSPGSGGVLLHAHYPRSQRRPAHGSTSLQRDLRALAVAMPITPGVPGALPSVLQEVQILQQYIRDVVILVEPPVPELAEQVPTREAVLRYLPDCPIAHFACHGFSDPDDPSQSTLLLHDHATAPLTVAVLSALRLDNVRLAYLSVSQTAVSVSSALLGGAVNLATAFHLAGYPHVIGTLWNIDDHASVQIAADFYRWLANSTPDVNTAAAALHHAIRNARNSSLMTPSAWAAHIHSGP